MAPYDVVTWGSWGEPVVHFDLGALFGFVLERAGFGSAKKLTSQFYLRDMSVLKVMFTGIITAMLLVYWTVGFGFLDLERVWVNPTYLGSGILGGLLFGFGFVVGGYCPGTALVAAATLKIRRPLVRARRARRHHGLWLHDSALRRVLEQQRQLRHADLVRLARRVATGRGRARRDDGRRHVRGRGVDRAVDEEAER